MWPAAVTELPLETLGTWSVFGVGVVALIRAWPILARIKVERAVGMAEHDGSMIEQLFARCQKLETDLARQVADCAKEQAEMRVKIEALSETINLLRRQMITYQLKLGEKVEFADSPPSEIMAQTLRAMIDPADIDKARGNGGE